MRGERRAGRAGDREPVAEGGGAGGDAAGGRGGGADAHHAALPGKARTAPPPLAVPPFAAAAGGARRSPLCVVLLLRCLGARASAQGRDGLLRRARGELISSSQGAARVQKRLQHAHPRGGAPPTRPPAHAPTRPPAHAHARRRISLPSCDRADTLRPPSSSRLDPANRVCSCAPSLGTSRSRPGSGRRARGCWSPWRRRGRLSGFFFPHGGPPGLLRICVLRRSQLQLRRGDANPSLLPPAPSLRAAPPSTRSGRWRSGGPFSSALASRRAPHPSLPSGPASALLIGRDGKATRRSLRRRRRPLVPSFPGKNRCTTG